VAVGDAVGVGVAPGVVDVGTGLAVGLGRPGTPPRAASTAGTIDPRSMATATSAEARAADLPDMTKRTLPMTPCVWEPSATAGRFVNVPME
jgi:hypothetical protein